MESNSTTVNLLGTSFVIRSTDSPDHLQKVLDYLTLKLDEIKTSVSISDPLKIALLTGLNIADELVKIRESGLMEQNTEEIAAITSNLIEVIDRRLGETSE